MESDTEKNSVLLADSESGERSQHRWPNRPSPKEHTTTTGFSLFTVRSFHSRLKILLIGIPLWAVLAVSFYLYKGQSNNSVESSWASTEAVEVSAAPSDSPFTGAFAMIPRVSQLPPRQRRMTMIIAWNNDNVPSYLRHFFYTMQLNADVLDLLFINRVQAEDDQCIDFDKAGINITWGGNVKAYCMTDKEWKKRYVDFLCSAKNGWNCNATEYDEVTTEYATRPDVKSCYWRPLLGYVFRDLMPHPENAFWAWMDLDSFAGDFRRYPFNFLSKLSILTSHGDEPQLIYMGGQLTAFNLDDEDLASAWKKFPELKTPQHFTRYLDGKMPEAMEERYWSYGYLRSDEDLPGSHLSYGLYSDLHGDDYYDGRWRIKNATQTYVISGRDIILASTAYSRAEVEDLIHLERSEPADDLGNIGWTAGQDGSSYLIENPDLGGLQAKHLAMATVQESNPSSREHLGLIEDQVMQTENCSKSPHWRLCIPPHPLTVTDPPVMRASLFHLKNQRPGHLLRRLERDQRPRGYERKLLKHHLWSKRVEWYEFPPFDITEDLILRLNFDSIEVFKMGEERDKTIYFRKEGEESIG